MGAETPIQNEMPADNAEEEAQETAQEAGDGIDQLEELSLPMFGGGSNKIEKFEKSLPFARTSVTEMFKRIEMAENFETEKNAEAKGVVSLETLARTLNSPCWQPLSDPESIIAKLLSDEAFKDAEKCTEESHIDGVSLRLFSVFHCQGKEKEKAEALYQVL